MGWTSRLAQSKIGREVRGPNTSGSRVKIGSVMAKATQRPHLRVDPNVVQRLSFHPCATSYLRS